MTAMRAAFTGYYGMSNFGDDLFGVICALAARRYWSAEPCVVGPVLESAPARSTLPRAYPSRWYGGGGVVGKASRLLSFVRGVQGRDVLVMGGGSVINARESFRKPLMLSAHRRGMELAAIGVSIGPFDDSRGENAAADLLRKFSYLSVRDARSHRAAVRMGVSGITHAGCDLAALLPSLRLVAARERQPGQPVRIGIAPCNYREDGEYAAPSRRRWEDDLVAALSGMARTQRIVVDVFSLNEHERHGDRRLAQALADRLRGEGVEARWTGYRAQHPLRTVEALAACDAVVSARLHGAIVAYLHAVPFMMIDYHPKCRDFADDVGLPPALRVTAERDGNPFAYGLPALLAGELPPAVPPQVYARRAPEIFECAPWAK